MSFKPVRLAVELPGSKEKIVIRRLSALEMAAFGKLPDMLKEMVEKENEDKKEPGQQIKTLPPEVMEYTVKCCVAAVQSHPVGRKLVPKRPEECGHIGPTEELSFYDLPDEDQRLLIEKVFGLLKGGEAAQAAASFPEGSGASGPAASNG